MKHTHNLVRDFESAFRWLAMVYGWRWYMRRKAELMADLDVVDGVERSGRARP